VGGSTIYEFETKAIDDLITIDRMVDALFVFNGRTEKPMPLFSYIHK